mmetsp:Transcript_56951/g.123281  ORF Transcript_56951/g.123281 Transcript_56951/m.123281 type:complete len:209 (+) Transcript_56951:791-1417(+)
MPMQTARRVRRRTGLRRGSCQDPGMCRPVGAYVPHAPQRGAHGRPEHEAPRAECAWHGPSWAPASLEYSAPGHQTWRPCRSPLLPWHRRQRSAPLYRHQPLRGLKQRSPRSLRASSVPGRSSRANLAEPQEKPRTRQHQNWRRPEGASDRLQCFDSRTDLSAHTSAEERRPADGGQTGKAQNGLAGRRAAGRVYQVESLQRGVGRAGS